MSTVKRGDIISSCLADIGPASVMVGNIVQGNRLAAAQGREIRFGDDEANPANKVLIRQPIE